MFAEIQICFAQVHACMSVGLLGTFFFLALCNNCFHIFMPFIELLEVLGFGGLGWKLGALGGLSSTTIGLPS